MPKVKSAVVVGLVAIILFSAAYLLALNAYQKESEDRVTLLVTGDRQSPDRVDMVANILSVDPQREEARIRLNF